MLCKCLNGRWLRKDVVVVVVLLGFGPNLRGRLAGSLPLKFESCGGGTHQAQAWPGSMVAQGRGGGLG
jgi:hypothetical protein